MTDVINVIPFAHRSMKAASDKSSPPYDWLVTVSFFDFTSFLAFELDKLRPAFVNFAHWLAGREAAD